MFTIFTKEIRSFAGRAEEVLICKGDTIAAHVRTWDSSSVLDDQFTGNLRGRPVSQRGSGWRKLTGRAAGDAQAWARDIVD